MNTDKKTAVVLGATGLIGKYLLALLLQDPNVESVTIIARNATLFGEHRKLRVIHTDFQSREWYAAMKVTHIFCCLGTTINAAGNKKAFRWVDHDIVLQAATMAKQHGAHFLVVSALGANAKSSSFYNRVKGEMENDVKDLRLQKLSIFQPSLLTGPRQDFRLGERMAQLVMWALPAQWRSIPARFVALAMLQVAHTQPTQLDIISSERIRRLAKTALAGTK